jgi:hypothetical protein
MKKVFAIFAIVGLMATASCGNKEVTEETTIEVVEPVEETAPVEEVVVDTTATEVAAPAAQ